MTLTDLVIVSFIPMFLITIAGAAGLLVYLHDTIKTGIGRKILDAILDIFEIFPDYG